MEIMYGKVIAAASGAYLLTFEHHVLPNQVGAGVMVVAGLVVATDIMVDGPQHRLAAYVTRLERRLHAGQDRRERERELRAAAREELETNHGIRMAEDLRDEDREWLREQAALAVKHYESTAP